MATIDLCARVGDFSRVSVKVFEIWEARWMGLEAETTPPDPRWVLKGRAHDDVNLGDCLALGPAQATVEEIHTYGKSTDLLSRMMTGELIVRWADDNSMLYLARNTDR